MARAFIVVLVTLLAALPARAQERCIEGGAPTFVVEAFDSWNGAAARLVERAGFEGTVNIVQTSVPDGNPAEGRTKPVTLVIYAWFAPQWCTGDPVPVPPESSPNWKIEPIPTLMELAARASAASDESGVRIVSSPWGELHPASKGAAKVQGDVRPHTSWLAPAGFMVWFEPGG